MKNRHSTSWNAWLGSQDADFRRCSLLEYMIFQCKYHMVVTMKGTELSPSESKLSSIKNEGQRMNGFQCRLQ